MAGTSLALKGIVCVMFLLFIQWINAMNEIDGLHVDIQTMSNGTFRGQCDEMNIDTVQQLNISDVNRDHMECACQIFLPDPSQPVSITAERKDRRYPYPVTLASSIWESTSSVALMIRKTKFTLMSCDLTYEQQLPVILKIGGNGAQMKCSRSMENIIRESICTDEEIPPSNDPVHNHPQDKALQMHLGMMVMGGFCAILILNVISIILIKYLTTRRRQTDVKRYGHVMRRRPTFRRQQTNMSHPYESILGDPEEMTDVVVQVGQNETSGARHIDYIPMNGMSRDQLIFADGTETETDLDAFVYPPSTHYDEEQSPNIHSRSAGYSYTYSSAENVNAQGFPRKFSIESLDSAAAMLRTSTRVKELARFLDNNVSGSFDSGYAERMPPTVEENEEESQATGGEKMDESHKERTERFQKAQHLDESVYVEQDSVSQADSTEKPADKVIPPSYIKIVDDAEVENNYKESNRKVTVCSDSEIKSPTGNEVPGYLSVF